MVKPTQDWQSEHPSHPLGVARNRMQRHSNVQDLCLRSDDEEDVRCLEQDLRDAQKVTSPNVQCMARQEPSPRAGWARSWVSSRERRGPSSLQPALILMDPKVGEFIMHDAMAVMPKILNYSRPSRVLRGQA